MFGKKAKLKVTGMSCGHCEKSVEEGLAEVAGVAKVSADHTKDLVTVRYKGECPNVQNVKTKVVKLGFEAGDGWVQS